MLCRSLSLVFAGMILSQAASASVTFKEAQAFFQDYTRRMDHFDPQVGDLYLDSSRIRTLRRYPTASDRRADMNGKQWKDWLTHVMTTARASHDHSRFRNVSYSRSGPYYKVEADRFSLSKCYWDHGYYMLIGRQLDGSLKIVEESFQTMPLNNCKLTSSNFSY